MLLVAMLAGCPAAPAPGNPEFNDAVRQSFIAFDAPQVEVAYGLRALEGAVYGAMDVTAGNSTDRSLSPERLTDADVAALDHPDVSPADALPVAVAIASPHPLAAHQHVQMLADHTPVEPFSPHHYDRTFLDGQDCWLDQGCERLSTYNELTKENALMTIPYAFYKDFRWIDLELPDPADVPAGEDPPVTTDDPRWGYVARSWQTESYPGLDGDTNLLQSYTIEVWIPRDDGALRMLAVWQQTLLGVDVSDDLVAGTVRVGIDDTFAAGDAWLDENAP